MHKVLNFEACFKYGIFIIICFCTCKQDKSYIQTKIGLDDRPASNKEMAHILSQLIDTGQLETMIHQNDLLAAKFLKDAQKTSHLDEKIFFTVQAATQFLFAGDYNKSIKLIKDAQNLIQGANFDIPAEFKFKVREILAIAFLRKGEIENCLKNHNAYSCLLPIQGPGQHISPEGSSGAIPILLELLNEKPDDLTNRWLLNIAHMTLGTYPSGVPSKWRIPEHVFDSDCSFPRFTDIAMACGVAVNDISGSSITEDFNNDGLIDIIASSYGLQDQLRYFENTGKGDFKEKTKEVWLEGIVSGLNIIQADYNNDGWMDVLVLRGAWLRSAGKHPNSLLKNDHGKFVDVTKEVGLFSLNPTQTASWADIDNDGDLDLFIGNESSNTINAPSELFINQGNGTFKEMSKEHNLIVNCYVKGCVFGDYNNDGWQDLYVSNLKGPNKLFKNLGKVENGKVTFQDVSKEAGVEEPEHSFPCWFFDVNNDGWQDIFVSGYNISFFSDAAGEVLAHYLGKPTKTDLPRLYINQKNGKFLEASKAYNIDEPLFTMGCNFGDINYDSYLDMYLGTGTPDLSGLIPNKMFVNNSGKSFYDVSTAGGFGHLQKGHGVSMADFDNDGDLDIYTVLGGAYKGDNFMNALYENQGFSNNWVSIELEGSTCNRNAIGSVIEITTPDNKKSYNVVNSGGSFGSNTLAQEIGLAKSKNIKSLRIRWAGETNWIVYDNIPINKFIKIKQGAAAFELLNKKPFKLNHEIKASDHEHHH